jgi:hypothetical protein
MARLRRWGGPAAWLLLLFPAAARAQFFTPPTNPLLVRIARAPGEQVERLRAGAYAAQWTLGSYQSAGATVRRDSSPGLLVSADYFLSEQVSIGGWWNRFSGSDRQTGRPDLPRHVADFAVQFWDIHVTYYLPEAWAPGWSLQVGHTSLHSHEELVLLLGGQSTGRTEDTLNLWIAKTQPLRARRALGSRHPVVLFGSIGYYPSASFHRAASLILGGSVDLSPRVSVSGSAWLEDLSDPDLRATVGLVGNF